MAILTEKWYIQFWRGTHKYLPLENCPNQKYFVISKNNKPFVGLYCGMENKVLLEYPDVWQYHAKGNWKDITGSLLKAANLPEEWDDSILKSKYVLVIDEEGNIIDNV